MTTTVYYKTPIGYLEVKGTATTVEAVDFVDITPQPALLAAKAEGCLAACVMQLDQYFKGRRRKFDLPLAPMGTPFQQEVWQALQTVGFGEIASYGRIAQTIGRPRAFRAVGAANGRNPISIIIPCHRIIGSNNTLTGYGGGLWRKTWLLAHEGWQVSPRQRVMAPSRSATTSSSAKDSGLKGN